MWPRGPEKRGVDKKIKAEFVDVNYAINRLPPLDFLPQWHLNEMKEMKKSDASGHGWWVRDRLEKRRDGRRWIGFHFKSKSTIWPMVFNVIRSHFCNVFASFFNLDLALHHVFFYFYFGSIGDWTQGLEPARQAFYHWVIPVSQTWVFSKADLYKLSSTVLCCSTETILYRFGAI